LRRRKVAQWGVLYAAGAWGFLQGLEYVSEAFDWPGQLRQVAILALLVGLPIVLVLAWYHGDRGQQRVSAAEMTIITLLFLLGGGIFWLYDRQGTQTGTAAVGEAESLASADRPLQSSPGVAEADNRPSIAVLPFDNRSKAEDDVFFVDGIHDDVLTQLSKISALRVISRTSVEQFRDTKLPIREIAGQLGVGRILEGGVQRAGDRVRITVQLIDAGTDAHLWAETYDRELTAANIFAIQSEVASAIAAALKTSLTTAERERVNTVPTQNLQAWEDYQLGKQRMSRRTAAELAQAEQYFRHALELDPKFALAYVGLADTLNLQTTYSGAAFDRTLAQADRAAGKALELDPDLAEALVSRASIMSNARKEPDQVEPLFRRALALNPNYATAHHWLSNFLNTEGRNAEALEHAARAAAIDPLSAVINTNLAGSLAIIGRFDEAEARYRKVIEIDPLMPYSYSGLAAIEAYVHNDFAEALRYQRKAVAVDPSGGISTFELVALLWDLGADDELTRIVAAARTSGRRDAISLLNEAVSSIVAGNRQAAFEFALKACELDPYCGALPVIVAADAEARRFAQARDRIEKLHPALFERTPRVTSANYGIAVLLAFILQNTGERDAANRLLEDSERIMRSVPRLGNYEPFDVAILALRGEKAQALATLRASAKRGWRRYWRLWRAEPMLAALRSEPEFEAVFAEIERDMAQQRAGITFPQKTAPKVTGP
jgi:TolB-like protein